MTLRIIMKAATLLMTIALLNVVSARELPPVGSEPKAFKVPASTTLSLRNGVKVTLVPFGTIPKTTISITVPAGNRYEGDQAWLADLAGQMLTEGAGARDADQLAAASADMGGEIGVGVTVDTTSAGLDVLSEFAPDAIALLADVLQRPTLPAQQFDRVRGNLLKNLAIARQQPQTQADGVFRKQLFRDHPYSVGLPDPAAFESITIADVRRFIEQNYAANGTRIYVAGQFDRAAVVAAIEHMFGGWKTVERPALVPPPTAAAPGRHFIARPDAPQSTLYLGLPVVDPTHPDHTKVSVMNTLLGGSFSSRVTSNIREDKGYTYSPRSRVSVNKSSGYWVQTADVTTNVTGPAIDEIINEIERLRAEPPAAEELDRIKNYRTGTFILGNATRGGLIGQLQFLDTHGLDKAHLESAVQRINAVSPADVQAMAERYLNLDDMTLVVVGDPAIVPEQLDAIDRLAPAQ
ncbi:MAG: M16 family metallopeptidase [Gammaproteobacteria bacterium]